MFSVASLLALLAFSITGSPVEVRNSSITLPMTRRLPFSNVTDILRHDRARVEALMEYSTHGRRGTNVPLTNMESNYIVSVQIGYPPITYNLVVDTYSAITWVGAGTTYSSRSGVDLEKHVAVNYHFGSFLGTIFQDTLTLTNGLTVDWMQIGVASTSRGFNCDGVLGIGPTVSSLGTLINAPGGTISSVTDYLFQQGAILRPIVGIFFQPIVKDTVTYGELYFGGAVPDMDIGTIHYTGVIPTPSSSLNWGIQQSITYGPIKLMPLTVGVVECGCTFLYIAAVQGSNGGVSAANGLIQISIVQYALLMNLEFNIGSHKYNLIPSAQIWPRSLNHVVFGNSDDIFLVVRSLPTPTGTGFDFINGYVFVQRFYTVFDARKNRIGFAETSFTHTITE
ncbi:aspartic peptidase domain-containing protein [Suillus spraguei]|nr:aspartic peptidase domain-containing protein [Suillus spraguei]